MKRFISILLVICALLTLVSCREKEDDDETTWRDEYDRGLEAMDDGDYEAAVKAFKAALKLDGSKEKIYLRLAESYLELGKEKQAVDALETGLEDAKTTDDIEAMLASLKDQPGKPGGEPSDQPEKDPSVTPGDEPAKEPDNTPIPAPDYSGLVTDAYNENVGYRELRIPQINLQSTEVRAINNEIWKTLYNDFIEEEMSYWLECDRDGYHGYEYIAYEWAVDGDTLSLIIDQKPVDWEWNEFYIYNISISDAKELSDRDFLAKRGMTRAEFEELIKKALYAGFVEMLEWSRGNEWGDEEFAREVIANTYSAGNLAEARPYISRTGELCAMLKVYSVAGADYYNRCIPLGNVSVPDDYPNGLN